MFDAARIINLLRRIGGGVAGLFESKSMKLERAKAIPWVNTRKLQQVEYVSVGRHTYGLSVSSVVRPTKDAPVAIGNFCSFAPGVVILAHADHPVSLPSTYPLKTLVGNLASADFDPSWANQDAVTKGAVNIGHDVWVGQSAIILSGVTIGNGAVVGAGAVVAKDIPPYAIAVGNPAKIVKYRFSPEIIQALETTEWWNLPDSEIEKLLPLFYLSPEKFIKGVLK